MRVFAYEGKVIYIPKKLSDFLEKKGALKLFIKNVCNDTTEKQIHVQSLMSEFSWGATEQGAEFWRVLNYQFTETADDSSRQYREVV